MIDSKPYISVPRSEPPRYKNQSNTEGKLVIR
jgi:hypothetical protein